MIRNPDCIRDVLLYLEENLKYEDENYDSGTIEHSDVTLYTIAKDICTTKGHEEKEVVYAAEQLLHEGFIVAKILNKAKDGTINYCTIGDISWSGHELLNTVRQQSVWEQAKAKATKYGMTSIKILSRAAFEVGIALIQNPQMAQNIIDNIK